MPIETIEKMINEHGTNVILKERLLLLKDQLVALYHELSGCRKKTSALADMICRLASDNQNLKLENRALNEKIESFHSANPHGYRCQHCGSLKIKKTGDKLHKIFADKGMVDALFICLDCEKVSIVMIDTLK